MQAGSYLGIPPRIGTTMSQALTSLNHSSVKSPPSSLSQLFVILCKKGMYGHLHMSDIPVIKLESPATL